MRSLLESVRIARINWNHAAASKRGDAMSKQDIVQNEESALLSELIRQQHISPVNNLDEVSRLWPADDDPDLLLEHVLNERFERRRLKE